MGGDVSAAGKVIGILQKHCPALEFDWTILSKINPQPFLEGNDPSKVSMNNQGIRAEKSESDLVIVGPAKCGWSTDYIESRINAKINGPQFSFLEAGTNPPKDRVYFARSVIQKDSSQEEKISQIHQYLFPTGGICMGLLPDSGIFFDQNRIDAQLSRGYCCPKPLLNIKDESLRNDILKSLESLNEGRLPDFDTHSFNSGYAHRPSSWGKFIDFVAIQEQIKDVTIVLVQHGEFDRPSFIEYNKVIFNQERLQLLERCGYGKITLKGSEANELVCYQGKGRNLSVIVRPAFTPEDMKYMQLASERLIATGMNTPAESWAAKCKLYLYENVANAGVTGNFLKQQIELASSIDPKLGKFLHLAGYQNKPLSFEEMTEAARFLRDPDLTAATLKFCDHVVQNYNFEDPFLGSFKKAVWHHYVPELLQIEADSMDEAYKEGILKHLSSFDSGKQVIPIKNLPLLCERVQSAVNRFLANKL